MLLLVSFDKAACTTAGIVLLITARFAGKLNGTN